MGFYRNPLALNNPGLKTCPLQEVIAHLSGLSQPQSNFLAHQMADVSGRALEARGHRPARLADEGYDSDALIRTAEARGMEAVIPPRSNRTQPREVDWFVYKERHLIECFLNKIKHYRRIFSRCPGWT